MPAREVAQRMLDLLLVKDMYGVADLWAEDGTGEFPFATGGAPTRLEGREAVRDYLADYPEKLDIAEFPSVVVHDTLDPDTIVVELTARGRSVRTDEPYELSYVAVIATREERIVSYRDYWSPVAAARATGTLPELVRFLEEAGA